MRPTRALRLRRETLAELGTRDLGRVAAGQELAMITGICPTFDFPCEDLGIPPLYKITRLIPVTIQTGG